ncbi:Prp 4 [Dactylonectria macrodidyma]|uniref:Prp 4 n=1 Tax=Dactylonectria macrodidyma TaxID=307937 RepID=A0A9P9IQH1_9HYPO|nr:Prp 4 [Dactylonectria macrodidyma]
MRLSTVLSFASVACAASPPLAGMVRSPRALFGLDERQTVFCEEIYPPYTCERSCGEGYTECIDWPTCYNPGEGQTCCSDGSYCAKGYYCVDVGCCPDGSSLEECGATKTLSVVPPPVNPPTGVSESATSAVLSSAIATTVLTTALRVTTSVAPILNMSTSAAPVGEITTTATVILETPTEQPTATAVETVPAGAGANTKVEYVLMAVFGAIGVFVGGL